MKSRGVALAYAERKTEIMDSVTLHYGRRPLHHCHLVMQRTILTTNNEDLDDCV